MLQCCNQVARFQHYWQALVNAEIQHAHVRFREVPTALKRGNTAIDSKTCP